jgi:hypothetical protein
MCLKLFFQGMVIEMSSNNKIQIFFGSNELIVLKGLKYDCVDLWKKLKNKLLILSFGRIINKIWNFKIDVYVMLKMKSMLNQMHPNIFWQQVTLFVHKRGNFHLWGPMIKPPQWHGYGQC